MTYRDPISVGPREDPNHWVEIADQLRRESVQRAQSRLGYQLKQATGGYDDQIVQSFLGEQAAQFDAEQGKIKDQARKLGGGLTVAMSVVETPRGPCFEPPLSDADVAGFLGKSSEAIGRMQESLGARGAARENTQEMLTRSQALAGAGERILNKFSYSEHLAQAGILSIALEEGQICGRGGPPPGADLNPTPTPTPTVYPRPTPTLRPRPTPTPKKRPTPTPTKKPTPTPTKKPRPPTPTPRPFSDPCADALKDLGVDPATAVIKRNIDRLNEQTYSDAAADLMPGDFSGRQIGHAISNLAGIDSRPSSMLEHESGLSAISEAVQSRTKVVDAILAAPEETYADLVFTASRNTGTLPIHPLLTDDDTPSAIQLFNALRTDAMRTRVDAAAIAIEQKSPRAPELAINALKELTGVAAAETRGALAHAIQSQDVAAAQSIIQRLRRELPLREKLVSLSDEAAKVVAPTAAEGAAAQVLYAEVVGRDALLAARALQQGTVNAPAAFERTESDAIQKLVTLSRDHTLVEVQPADASRLTPQRLELHRRRVELAKSASGEIAVATTLSQGAPPVAQAEAELEGAALQVNTLLQRAAHPSVRAFGSAAPVLAGTAARLKARIAAVDSGAVPPDATTRAIAAQDLASTEKILADGMSSLRPLVSKVPGLDQGLKDFATARARLETSLSTLATRQSNPSQIEKIIQNADRDQLAAARTAAIDLGISPGRSLGASLAHRTAPSDLAVSGPDRILPLPAPRADASTSDRIAYADAADSQNRTMLRQTAAAAVAPPAASAGSSAPAMSQTSELVQAVRQRVGAYGWAQDFKDERELQQFAQSRVGGLGIVHLKSDLENPEYVAEQFKARVGGLGWTHTFKDENELQQFAQSRVGQFGIVHKRSDLQDPAYLQKLFESRIGGMGWSHTFKDLDEYKAFLESRLGGFGRVTTCLDLQRRGVPPAMARAILDDAASRSKLNWESDAQYEERMLHDRSDLFARDANGNFYQKTYSQQQQEKKAQMLASGEWIQDPRTGNLVRRDSKAGAQVLDVMLDAKPRTVRVKLADGRWMEFSVDGFSSLQSALDDALNGMNLQRDASGNWVDAGGRVILGGEAAAKYDADYRNAMDRRAPGFSSLLTYRREPERPGVPPPSPTTQFRQLEDNLRDSFGYTIRDFSLNDREFDLEVRPGESINDALRRVLAEDERFSFNQDGDIIDRRTGRPARTAGSLANLDDTYRDKVAAALFGDDVMGVSRETLYLAEHGTPAQRAQAQAILAQTTARLAQLQQVTSAQEQLLRDLEDLDANDSLTPSERRSRQREIQKQLDQLADTRSSLENSLIDDMHAANRSAQRVVQKELTYTERTALASADKVKALANSIDAIRAELLRDPSPTERRNLERELREKETELFNESRAFRDLSSRVEQGSPIRALAPEVELAAYGITSATVADVREARAAAYAVRYETVNGKTQAYYVGMDGRPLVDPHGKTLYISEQEANGFEKAQINDLARHLDDQQRDQDAYRKWMTTIGELQAKIAATKSTATRNDLQRQLAFAQERAGEIAQRIDAFVDKFNGYVGDDAERRKTVLETAAVLAMEREAAKEALKNGASTIEVLDENGNWVKYENPEMRRLREEREARLSAAGVSDPAMLAAAREAASPANPPAGTAPDLTREAERKAAQARQELLTSDYEAHARGLLASETAFAKAESDLLAARAAAFGRNDPALTQALAKAEKAFTDASANLNRQRIETANAAAIAGSNDPALADRFNQLTAAIEQSKASVESLSKAANEIWSTLLTTPGLPAPVRAALEAQLVALEAAKKAAINQALVQAAALSAARNNAAYTASTAEYNASRLAELQRRVADSGKPAKETLSSLELEELDRRTALSSYFSDVGNAQTHLKRLGELTERARSDPGSLSIADKVELDQGLSEKEMRLLVGDTQRRSLLEASSRATDPVQAEALRSLIGKWMTDPEGARNGTLLLNETDTSGLVTALGFLDRTDIYQSARNEAEARVQTRKADLETARAEFKRDPTAANARIVDLSMQSVASAEQLLADADRALAKARDAAPSSRVSSAFSSLKPEDTYLDIVTRQHADAAKSAETASPGSDSFLKARLDYAQGVEKIRGIQSTFDANRATIEQDLLNRNVEIGGLRGNYYALEKRLNEENLDASTRSYIEKRMAELETQIGARDLGIKAQQSELRHLETDRESALASVLRTLPQKWNLDPAARAQEELARHTALYQANSDYEQTRAGHAAKLDQFDQRIRTYENELALAKSGGDTARVTSLQQAVADARLQRSEYATIMENSEKGLETLRNDLIARNRADGIGPSSNYELDKFLVGLGIDPKSAYAANADLLAAQRASADRAVNSGVAANVSKGSPSLARLFLDETIANLTPQTLVSGTAGTIAGVGKGAVHLIASVPDLVEMAGKGLYFAAKTELQAAAAYGDILGEALTGRDLGLLDTVGTSSLDSINRGISTVRNTSVSNVVNTAGALGSALVDQALKRIQRDGDLAYNSAELASQVVFEIGIGFVNPAASATQAAQLAQLARATSAGEKTAALASIIANSRAFETTASLAAGARDAIAATQLVTDAAALGRSVMQKVATVGKILDEAAALRASLNASELGQRVNSSGAGILFDNLVNLSRAEVDLAEEISTKLSRADGLVRDAAAATPEDAATFLERARILREQALTTISKAETSSAVVNRVNLTHDLARVQNSLVDSATLEAAVLATGVRTTPEGLAAARTAIADVRSGAAGTPRALDVTRPPVSNGPASPLDEVMRQAGAKGLTPDIAEKLVASEADALASLRTGVQQRIADVEKQIATHGNEVPAALKDELSQLNSQATRLQRDESVLRAIAQSDDPHLRAQAIAEITGGASEYRKGELVATPVDQAAKGATSVMGWAEARARSPELGELQQLVVDGKTPPTDLVMNLKTDPRAMRALKNAPEPVRTAFNSVEEGIYKVHDEAVVEQLKRLETLDQRLDPHAPGGIRSTAAEGAEGGRPVPWAGKEIKVQDFRTPGAPPGAVNTDRDYRVIYKIADTADGKGEWIEIPRKYWDEFSHEKFAEVSGYTPEKVKAMASSEDLAAWNNWDPSKHDGHTLDREMKEKWAELHQQLATDKPHPEASADFSDQIRDAAGNLRQLETPNIVAVQQGRATLLDAQRLGMMYNEKADAFLRLTSARYAEGDKLEASAQMNKAIEMLNAVRNGYTQQGIDVGRLSERMEKASALLKSLAPFDHSVSPDRILAVEKALAELQFGTSEKNSINAFKEALDSQFHALGMAADTRMPRGVLQPKEGLASVIESPRPPAVPPGSPPARGPPSSGRIGPDGAEILDPPDLPYHYAPGSLERPEATIQGFPRAPDRTHAYNEIFNQQVGESINLKDPGGYNLADLGNNQVHELGKFLGEGAFSRVYELGSPKYGDAVIKFRLRGEEATSAADMVADAALASDRLERAGIPQLKVLATETEGNYPYVVVEKLPKDAKIFDHALTGSAEGRASLNFTPEHERAVMKLYEDLANQGLVARDLKIDNLFFTEKDGKITAGVLDHDFILPFEEAKKTDWFALGEMAPRFLNISSINGKPKFDTAHQFMAYMLESRGWISPPTTTGGAYTSSRMNIDLLKGTPFETLLRPPKG